MLKYHAFRLNDHREKEVMPAPIAAKLRDLGMKNEKRMVEISIYGIKLLILQRFIAYNKNNKNNGKQK